jgi:2-polyprenyl-6-methoxyphenol hydroxylase-like FAD-dependent oxidoreductase
MRANLMVYRDMRDPWLREMRHAPKETLVKLMPGFGRLLGDFEVPGAVKIRPADLYTTRGVEQAGIVLVGDAFATSCPAAGTGTTKVFTDVERLCNVHIPAWLATPGMGAEKIAAFYADPVKVAADSASLAKAYSLRSLSIDQGLAWKCRRWARFLGRSAIRRIRETRDRLAARAALRRGGALGSA